MLRKGEEEEDPRRVLDGSEWHLSLVWGSYNIQLKKRREKKRRKERQSKKERE